jgi:hypothetical protein
MIIGAFLFLVANVAVLLGAHELLRQMRTGEPSVDTVIFLLLRFLLISGTVILTGLTAALTRWGLGIAGLVALAVLLASGAHHRLPRVAFPEADRWMKIFAAVVAIRLLLQVWFFAPHLGDALAYHLPKVAEWVQNGRFTREMGLHPHVTFPAGFELIETWWVVFLHHDVLIEMAGVEFLFLAFAGMYALGRRLGLASRWSFFAGLLYVMTPGLHLSATSCLNDAPVAALVVATFALVAWRTPLGIVLLSVALGCGVKATYIYALPGVALLWVLSRKEICLPFSGPRISAALVVVAFGIGGFWYGRNLLWFGNPVYPVGSPGYAEEPVAVQTGPRLSSFLANAWELVNIRIYDNQGAYGANVDNIAGWGAPAFACGLLALMLIFMEDRETRRIAMCFLLSLACSFFLIIHDPWSMKYVFFFPAILAHATARLARTFRGAYLIAGITCVFSFLGSTFSREVSSDELAILGKLPWQERSAAIFLQSDTASTTVGCWGGFQTFSYVLYSPDFSRRVVYLRGRTAEELLSEMRINAVGILYVAPTTVQQSLILQECLKRKALSRIHGAFYSIE